MGIQLPHQDFFSRIVIPTPWTRPTDWPTITDTSGEVQFLFSDINDASCTIRTTFSRTSGSQNIVIDWGDSTSDTVTATTSTDTTHVYTPGTGTPCSRGYTTFKIRVYFTGTGVSSITNCRIFPILISGNTTSPSQECALLEVYYGDGTQTATPTNFYNSSLNISQGIATFNFLEYVKLPSSVTWNDLSNLFYKCTSLAKVVMPTSASSLTTLASMFGECYKLQSLTFPSNSTGITNLSNTFVSCYNLSSVTFPTSLNSCTTLNNCFSTCFSLKNITFPSLNACTNFTTLFNNCRALEWVRFTSLPTPSSLTTTNFNQMFQNCRNLENVYFPVSCSSNSNFDCTQTFGNCLNLKTIQFPLNFNPSTMSNTFNGCGNLIRVVFQSPASRIATFSSCFQSCTNLKEVKLPSSVSSAGVDFSNCFTSCNSIETINIPSGYTFTNLSACFSSCRSLTNLNWTPGVQNSITSMSVTFSDCSLLKSVTLPSSMTSLNTLNSTFSTCYSLESISFPTSLNACTTMSSTFSNCGSLKSVTLPTSMSSCTNFSSTFSQCFNLTGCTLPITASTSLSSFNNTFGFCNSIKQISFPSHVQYTAVTDIQACFGNCSNLTTITNFDKIGSTSTTGTIMNADTNTQARFSAITFVSRLSRLSLAGNLSTEKADVQNIRLTNTGTGQWGGASPQIQIANTLMDRTMLVTLFNDMAAQGSVVSKTINITNCPGAASLTAGERAIITSIGWTITG